MEFDTSDNFRIKITFAYKTTSSYMPSTPWVCEWSMQGWSRPVRQLAPDQIPRENETGELIFALMIWWIDDGFTWLGKGLKPLEDVALHISPGDWGTCCPLSVPQMDGPGSLTHDAAGVYFFAECRGPCPESDGHGLDGAPNGCKTLWTRQVTPASAGVVAVAHNNNSAYIIMYMGASLESESMSLKDPAPVLRSIIDQAVLAPIAILSDGFLWL